MNETALLNALTAAAAGGDAEALAFLPAFAAWVASHPQREAATGRQPFRLRRTMPVRIMPGPAVCGRGQSDSD